MISRRTQTVPGGRSSSLTMVLVLCSVIVSSLLCLVSSQSDYCGTSLVPLITGGSRIVKGEYPWLAALYRSQNGGNWSQFCGGALITPRIVITAAQCLVEVGQVIQPENITVGLGKIHRDFYHNEDFAIIANVSQVIVHDRYLGALSSFALDVGLLVLNVTVEISDYIMPVCIDLDSIIPVKSGATVHFAGWGTSENGTLTDTGLAAELSYLGYYDCLNQSRHVYRKYVTHDKFCSLGINGSTVHRGNGGGPLTYLKDGRHFVVGIISTKFTDETYDFTLFTDLSALDIRFWLKDQLNKLQLQGNEGHLLTNDQGTRKPYTTSVPPVGRSDGNSTDCGTSTAPLVTRGRPIVQGEYPWLAALYQLDEEGKWHQFCGGALLTPRIVLTAAHCLVFDGEANKPENIKVGLGKLYRDFYHNEDYATIANVREVIVPERFRGSQSLFALNVGLLKLSIAVETSDNVLPVCIDLDKTTILRTRSIVHASGWGMSENGTSTDRALAADMSYLDYHTCITQVREPYRKYITHDKFCSISINGSNIDRGDSGGALTYFKNGRHFVVGVVNTKIRDETVVSIFTDLSSPEVHFWVKEQLANSN